MKNVSDMSDDELLEYYSYHKTQESLCNSGQMVRKILLNSYYGGTAHTAFCLYDIRMAESITLSGQLAIRWIGRVLNEELNKLMGTTNHDFLIYGDTDSIYCGFDPIVEKCGMQDKDTPDVVEFLDKFCKDYVQDIIDTGYQQLFEYTNAYEQQMFMDREVIASSGIFCSKKRYALSVWDMEGVRYTDEPYQKVLGLDVVKSSTPEVCRNAMKKTIRKMLNSSENDVQLYIRNFEKEYEEFEPQEIAFPRGVNKLEESYSRPDGSLRSDVTVPIHSRASINYNNELRILQLEDYEVIRNGDKMKFIHLELPNRLQQNVIGFVDTLPEEFNLHHKIDYETMFFKTYLKPMDAIMQLIGWEAVPTPTLEDMFIDDEPKMTTTDAVAVLDDYFGEEYE